VIQAGLLRAHRSFGTGQALALLHFAGFTSLFFTLSILWQNVLGHSAVLSGMSRCWPGWATGWSSRCPAPVPAVLADARGESRRDAA
jgi:hypothetical protein